MDRTDELDRKLREVEAKMRVHQSALEGLWAEWSALQGYRFGHESLSEKGDRGVDRG